MTKPVKYKKLRKFFRDPNMFFYDMFRKRVFKDASITTMARTETTSSTTTGSNNPGIDLLEVNRLGVVEYIRKHLNAGTGPEDGSDPNSLLIWNGYLNGLIGFIAGLKEATPLDATIYTLGGGYNVISRADDKFDVRAICKSLNNRPDFVIELSNPLGEMYVLHIYLFDLAPDGLATVRSTRAWIRRFPLEQIDTIFSSSAENPNKYPAIDAVYTWVNHADPDWQAHWAATFPEEPYDPDRYTSNDELLYSLRSLNKYAPWLNKIHIVSNCSCPEWLDLSGKINWVKHEEIFPDRSALPTFNSHAIETCLHRIDGLTESFIYLNDDFVLSQPCLPSDFFDETGRSLAYFEPYGMVSNSPSDIEQPDYLIAANNSKALIKSVYSTYEARNLHRHVPYALKKSILSEVETKFSTSFDHTRHAKRRSDKDINLTSFLYHHYAYASGKAVKADATGLIVRPGNASSVAGRDSYKYKLLCFNDGNGSSIDGTYKTKTQAFFDKRFPERAPWERRQPTIEAAAFSN